MFSTETIIRVRYADTDQMKMVYYARYFEYFEQGRSDLLRAIGMPYPTIEKMGYYLPVVEAKANFIKSARYDDEIVVKTIVKDLPQVRFRIEYEIHNPKTKELLVEGYTIHSFVYSQTGKPTRAPLQFLKVLREVLEKNNSMKGLT